MQLEQNFDFLRSGKKPAFAGRYSPVALLGEGTTSWVFKAEDLKVPGKFVAVKILKPQFSGSAEDLRYFWTEVSITQTLSHANIIQVLGSGKSEEGFPYLIMEYAEGGSLKELIQSRPDRRLTFSETLQVLNAISAALSHAHQLGAVHRDLKPANILIGKEGQFKLSDFGTAHQRSFSKTSDTEGRVGTPYYMSPEQIQGSLTGPQADVYALGIMGYELMMGHPPFQGSELNEVFDKQLNARLPGGTVEEAGVPCWFEALLFKATKKDAAQRHASGKEFRRELLQNARRELGASPLEDLINFFRPNGILCTRMRRRGWSRPRTAAAILAAGIVIYLAVRLIAG